MLKYQLLCELNHGMHACVCACLHVYFTACTLKYFPADVYLDNTELNVTQR